MVNVLDYPQDKTKKQALSVVEWDKAMEIREQVFSGFYANEVEKGLAPEVRSLSSASGQDYIRALAFRVLEEMGEALDSVDKVHEQEEVIDSFNYLLSIMLYDRDLFSLSEVAIIVMETLHLKGGYDYTTGEGVIGSMTIDLTKWSELLRNRSWMKESQSLQFLGKESTKIMFINIFRQMIKHFNSPEELLNLYLAKNAVLQFRLDSNY